MLNENEVEVSLPQFKMEENYDLKNVLISMGMTDAFDVTRSDFSGKTYSINICGASLFEEQNISTEKSTTYLTEILVRQIKKTITEIVKQANHKLDISFAKHELVDLV